MSTNNPAAPPLELCGNIGPNSLKCIRPAGHSQEHSSLTQIWPSTPAPAEKPQPATTPEEWKAIADTVVEKAQAVTEAFAPDPRDPNIAAAPASVGQGQPPPAKPSE